MQSKLIRDKVPELAKAEGKDDFEYIIAASDKTYVRYLAEKFVEVSNGLLQATDDKYLDSLAEVLTVVNALATAKGHTAEDLKKAYEDGLEHYGGYEKRYVMMIDEPAPAAEKAAESEDK